MSRTRRMIRSNSPYELIIRAHSGLPFPALSLIEWMIKSSLARAQRDEKVTLCHFVWMGNHAHILLVAQDPQSCIFFIQEVQKKITDALKRLLGVRRLNLWEGSPTLAEILDLDAAIKKIGYIYANPAKASLVDSIESFPGVSSWKKFMLVEDSIEAAAKESVPWLRLPTLKKLPSHSLTNNQDHHITRRLIDSCNENHDLVIKPNAWMKPFGITESSGVSEINSRVKASVILHEQEARERRNGKVLGPEYLRREPIMKPHEPKTKGRRVFVISNDKNLRILFLETLRTFISECRECYLQWRDGNFTVAWPPGAFRPPMRPLAAAIC